MANSVQYKRTNFPKTYLLLGTFRNEISFATDTQHKYRQTLLSFFRKSKLFPQCQISTASIITDSRSTRPLAPSPFLQSTPCCTAAGPLRKNCGWRFQRIDFATESETDRRTDGRMTSFNGVVMTPPPPFQISVDRYRWSFEMAAEFPNFRVRLRRSCLFASSTPFDDLLQQGINTHGRLVVVFLPPRFV